MPCSYEFEKTDDEDIGAHHPLHYLRPAASSRSHWLTKLFDGEDPADSLSGNSHLWAGMKALPFGNGEHSDLEHSRIQRSLVHGAIVSSGASVFRRMRRPASAGTVSASLSQTGSIEVGQ